MGEQKISLPENNEVVRLVDAGVACYGDARKMVDEDDDPTSSTTTPEGDVLPPCDDKPIDVGSLSPRARKLVERVLRNASDPKFW